LVGSNIPNMLIISENIHSALLPSEMVVIVFIDIQYVYNMYICDYERDLRTFGFDNVIW
jgi:hypothetical protein